MKKIIIGLTAAFITSQSMAGVIRHDVNEQAYLDLAQNAQFDPVGRMFFNNSQGSFICSGTLISDQFVLTAAHCLDDSQTSDVTFDVGGNRYNGERWRVHQNWDPLGSLFDGWDIALLKLDSIVNNVTAANLYTGNSEIGQVGTHVGFGASGDGLTGSVLPPGNKRAGLNEIDEFNLAGEGHDRILWNDFDAPLGIDPTLSPLLLQDQEYLENPIAAFGRVSGTALDLEYIIGGGDSGGGYFLEENGQWFVAGVHSFGASIDAATDDTYGDFSGSTRVSSFVDWIGRTQQSLAIPEPNTVMLLALSLFGLSRIRQKN
ncbi:trypsin-like serine protease [Thalassotalea montiporae]